MPERILMVDEKPDTVAFCSKVLMRLGGCDLLSKPFGVPDLREAIERALDRVRQRRARGDPATPGAPTQQHGG